MSDRSVMPERPRRPSAQRHRMAFAWLSAEAFAALEAEAERRGVHCHKLAGAVLELVCRDRLFDAVLVE